MSSNIEVHRICEYCGNEFTARTTVTRFCSDTCRKKAYKARQRAEKIEKSNNELTRIKQQSVEALKAKEFLTVREVAQLLNCSVRSAYYHIKNGKIKAVNLGQRLTRVKRSDIDKIFNQYNPPPQTNEPETVRYDIKDCYNLTEIQNKFGVSEKAIHEIIKRNNIPKIKKGRYAYVPKIIVDELLT